MVHSIRFFKGKAFAPIKGICDCFIVSVDDVVVRHTSLASDAFNYACGLRDAFTIVGESSTFTNDIPTEL